MYLTDINRRRVYDIVNVLESLEMVSKQKIKNEYKWHGRDHLVQTLSRLKVRLVALFLSDVGVCVGTGDWVWWAAYIRLFMY